MARIPLQSLVSARQSGVAIAPGVFQQTAEAAHGLLSSVAGATQMVKAQFDKAQDIHNQSAISEGRRKFRDAQGEFQNRMLDPKFTPAMWGPEWQDTLKGIEAEIGLNDSKMPPAVSRALKEDFQTFAGSSLIQISGAALKENLKKGNQNFQRDYQYNKANGNHQANKDLIKTSEGLIFTAEEAEDWARATDGIIKQEKMEVHESNDPDGFIKAVKNGEYDLSELHEIQAIKSGENQKDVYESEGLDMITLMVKAGDQIKNVEELKVQLDNDPNISELSKKAYIKHYKNNKPLSNSEMFALDDKVDALWEFRGDPDKYRAEWSKINNEVRTHGTRTGLGGARSELYRVRPSNFTQEKLDQAAEEQRAEDLKPVEMVGREMVAARAKGINSIESIELKNDDVADVTFKAQLDENEVFIRAVLRDAMSQFIQDFPGGAMPTKTDMVEFLDKNGDDIVSDALAKKPFVIPEPVETAAQKAAAEADGFLHSDVAVPDTLIPKN